MQASYRLGTKPTHSQSILRLECSSDNVVEKEMILVCTTLGWGPHQAGSAKAKLPACKANACPNLLVRKMEHGAWDCRPHNTTKSCKNQRTGEVYILKCHNSFMVQTLCIL